MFGDIVAEFLYYMVPRPNMTILFRVAVDVNYRDRRVEKLFVKTIEKVLRLCTMLIFFLSGSII